MLRYSSGQVAERTGFSIDTLRYYERVGLLEDIARNSGGQRVFTEDDVSWLMILRCLRETGMPIQRMIRFAQLARGGEETIPERVELLQEHDRDVDAKIAQLYAEQEHIRGKIAHYRNFLREQAAARDGLPA
jgi:DNA-binding transcriptional MerR regulator